MNFCEEERKSFKVDEFVFDEKKKKRAYLLKPQSKEPVNAMAKPRIRVKRLRQPLISLYRKMPHSEATIGGPLLLIGFKRSTF